MQKPNVYITVEGGEIQSVAIDPDIQNHITIIVKDFDINDELDHPQIMQDEYGDLCEWKIWDSKSMEHLSEEKKQFLQLIPHYLNQRLKSD